MVRRLVFSDIHGNYTAFDSFINYTQNTIHLQVEDDGYRCLGDVFGYGPQYRAAWNAIYQRDKALRAGNHDVYLSMALNEHWKFHLEVNKPVLMTIFRQYKDIKQDAELKTRLIVHGRQFEPLEECIDGYRLVYVHGTPYNRREDGADYYDGYLSPFTPAKALNMIRDAIQMYQDAKERVLIFVGHTHFPTLASFADGRTIYHCAKYSTTDHDNHYFDLKDAPRVLLLNGGSIGQPRTSEGGVAHAVHLDTQSHKLRFIRLEYSLNAILKELDAWNYSKEDLAELSDKVGQTYTEKDWIEVKNTLSDLLRRGQEAHPQLAYDYDEHGFCRRSE